MGNRFDYHDDRQYITGTIESGNTTSDVINIGGGKLVGLICPSALTGASLKFAVSNSIDGNFNNFKNAFGTEISVPISANDPIEFAADDFRAWSYIKLVSDATEASDREFTLIVIRS